MKVYNQKTTCAKTSLQNFVYKSKYFCRILDLTRKISNKENPLPDMSLFLVRSDAVDWKNEIKFL